jgi:Mg2+/Co2+ transporter CorB
MLFLIFLQVLCPYILCQLYFLGSIEIFIIDIITSSIILIFGELVIKFYAIGNSEKVTILFRSRKNIKTILLICLLNLRNFYLRKFQGLVVEILILFENIDFVICLWKMKIFWI